MTIPMHPDAVKRIYLVRHGRTPGNEARAHQTRETPLSEAGLAQAARVGERFTRIAIDIILSSTMVRAHQTAQAISATTGVPIVLSDLLIEHLKPTVLQGKLHDDPEAVTIWKWVAAQFSSSQKHSDEENFEDLKRRATEALALIEARQEKTIAVVMHGTILKMVLCCMIFGESLTADMFVRFMHALNMENTGITVVDFVPSRVPELPHQNTTPWHVRVINDSAHLG